MNRSAFSASAGTAKSAARTFISCCTNALRSLGEAAFAMGIETTTGHARKRKSGPWSIRRAANFGAFQSSRSMIHYDRQTQLSFI